MNVDRFPRANRDDATRSSECTDIPGFYDAFLANGHKRTAAYEWAIYIVAVVAVFVVFLLPKFWK